MYNERDCYEWIDPIETVERLIDELNRLEDEHRAEARHMAIAFSDATYSINRRAEEIMRPAMERAALEIKLPTFVVPK